MELAEITRLIEEGKVEYVKIGAADIEGVYRGKRVAAKHFLNSLEDGFAQCDVLFGWDIGEVVLPNLKFSNWERGFADIVMKPDLSTFAVEPWEDHVASAICDLWSEHGERVTISPRYVLQRVVERARAMGFEPLGAAELEFRFFRENMVSLRDKDFGPNLTPLNPGFNCYSVSQSSADEHLLGRIARMMRDRGIEIEGYNREHGPGMYEMNIRYADAVSAGDYTMLFKNGVKEICHQMGLTASFMAKWNDQEDGSSGHSHLSLWDRNRERNVFWDEGAEGHMSQTMRQFLAGVLEKLPECMALYAPVINSYKRYVEGTWAPLKHHLGHGQPHVFGTHHQRQQRRHPHREPRAGSRRQLLPGVCRHAGQRVVWHRAPARVAAALRWQRLRCRDGGESVGGRAYQAVSAQPDSSHRPVRAERVGQGVFRHRLCGALHSHETLGSQRIRESRHQLGS